MNETDVLINEIACYVCSKRLEVPAILFLEANKPLALLGGAAVTVSIPFLGAVFRAEKLKKLAVILSDRKSIEALIQAIEKCSESEKE